MLFYPSKTHDVLNRKPFFPETMTQTAMANPHYARVTFAPGVKVIEDSGAFQERDMNQRLTAEAALNRQLTHRAQIAAKSGYDFQFEAVVTYDMLVGVDEALVEGKRVKQRGTFDTAREAVRETIASAEYYATQRKRISTNIAFSCQGAEPEQYAECAQELVSLMEAGDIFAFGGFCILGKHKRLLPKFVTSLRLVLPMLQAQGIKRAHLLGICWAPALEAAEKEGARYGVNFTTDSSSLEMNSIMGRVWYDGQWRKMYSKTDKDVNYHPADLTMTNIRRFTDWLKTLTETHTCVTP